MSAPSAYGTSRVAIAGLVILGCYVAFLLGSRAPNKQPQAEPQQILIDGLTVEPSLLNLGEVWEANDFAFDLPIENRSERTIKVADFLRSCGCLEVSPPALTIAPGASGTVRVSLDLTEQRRIEHLEAPIRSFVVQLAPILNMKAWPDKAWTIRAAVKNRVTLSKVGVNFGDTTASEATSLSQKVEATVHVPTGRLEASVSPNLVTVNVKRADPESNQYEISLVPKDNLPPGPLSAKLVLQLIGTSGERLPGAVLSIKGNVLRDLRALPARVLFGTRRIGESAEAQLVLQASADAKIRVNHIETESPDVHVDPSSVDGIPPGRCFRVVQRVTKEGESSSSVKFTIEREGQPRETLAVEISYRGQAGAKDSQPPMNGGRHD